MIEAYLVCKITRIMLPKWHERIKGKIDRLLHSVIDKASIKIGYRITRETNPSEYLQTIEKIPKIAFVKQDLLSDLYCCPPFSSPETIIFSTLLRNGPFTLFSKLKADFWMVKPEDAAECQIWRERCFTKEGVQFIPYEDILKIRKELPAENINGLTGTPETLSVDCREIDWGQYDIVIAIDIPVPAFITRQFPNTVWCYCLMEPYMSSYVASSRKPIVGYDLFLNQRSRTFRVMPTSRFHEIDFPYCLQYYGCYHELLNLPLDSERQGVFIEKHTERILTASQMKALEEYGPIYHQSGSTRQMLENLIKSKYFVRAGGNVGLRWANSMIEGIAAGCLFIGNPNEFVNKSLFTPKTCAYTFDQVLDRIAYYEKRPNDYKHQVEHQRKLVNWLCFCRPLQELLDKAALVKNKKSYEASA